VPIVAGEMVLCRYNGLNDSPAGGLAASKTVTDGAVVEQWRTRFNRLPPAGLGLRSCPMDDEVVMRTAFIASPRSYVVLRVKLSGCRFVTSGAEIREAKDPDARFGADLLRLSDGRP
jgi:hypothetical protein